MTRWFFASALPSFLRWGGFVICLYFCLAFFQWQKIFKSKKISKLKKWLKCTSSQPIITAQRGGNGKATNIAKVQKYRLFHGFWVVWDVLGYLLKLDKKEKRQQQAAYFNGLVRGGNSKAKKIAKIAKIQIILQVLSCLGCFLMFFDVFWSRIKKEKGSSRKLIVTAQQKILHEVQK